MFQKPSIPKGTRDFGPLVMQKREYIFNIIKSVFRLHGYQPLETPSMENLTTLLGKYGDEGDKLLFRILNSGDFLSKVKESDKEKYSDHKFLMPYISEKGLRYDLTVPFARYVVMNRNDIQFPFKRYQLQNVWRADRPQKGRYREFYQCDIDVIGSKSLLNELELVKVIDTIFNKLNIKVKLLINNRKILEGILEKFNIDNMLIPFAIAIDKLEKTSYEEVLEEMTTRGIEKNTAAAMLNIAKFEGDNESVIKMLEKEIYHTPTGKIGIDEIKELFSFVKALNITTEVAFDMSLARGLNYYTGTIFEVKSKDVSIGSICGGGRYDNLTAFFGVPDISGVGISFGADRIYDVMNESGLFPEDIEQSTDVLIANFGAEHLKYYIDLLTDLHNNAISAEIYPDSDKLKKQMNYANKKHIKYVVMAGDEEILNQTYTLKNMKTGEQFKLNKSKLIDLINKKTDEKL